MECEDHQKPAPATGLPEEVWLEILKYFDKGTLLKLTLVCKTWNQLIFNYLAHRFELNLTVDEDGEFPQKDINWVPERIYKRLHMRSVALDSPPELMKVFEKLAPNLESLKLSLASLDFTVLVMHVLKLCPRLKELYIQGNEMPLDMFHLQQLLREAMRISSGDTFLDVDQKHKLNVFEKIYERCVLKESDFNAVDEAQPKFPTITSVGLNVSDLDMYGGGLLSCFPNATDLELIVYETDLGISEIMPEQLKVLKMMILEDVEDVLSLRLPTLEVLVLKLDTEYEMNDLKEFLLGCKALKTAMLTFTAKDDVFPAIAEALPLVERLQISGNTETSLDGLEKMTHLKELSLKGITVKTSNLFFVQRGHVMSVKKLECNGVMFTGPVSDTLDRFQRAEIVTLTVRSFFEMSNYGYALCWARQFTVWIDWVGCYFLKQIRKMGCLERLVIRASDFDPEAFPLLQRVIVLPTLKSLVVDILEKWGPKETPFVAPMDLATKIASANRKCSFVLNGKRVEPAEEDVLPVAGEKRKALPCAESSDSD